jgi:hypothetical protein
MPSHTLHKRLREVFQVFVLLCAWRWCGGFAGGTKLPREDLFRKGARRKVLPRFEGFSLRLCAFAGDINSLLAGMTVAKSPQ